MRRRPSGRWPLPKRVEHRQPRVRRDLASALRSAAAGLAAPGVRRGAAPRTSTDGGFTIRSWRRCGRSCVGIPRTTAPGLEPQIRQAERYLRIERDNAQLEKKVAAATNSLARTFDRIVGLLTERGFIQGPATDPRVTDDGRLLARIYSESDLLVAECLRTGAWAGLKPAELAAVVSAVLYETRGRDGPGAPFAAEVPTPRLRQALQSDVEAVHRVARRRADAPDRPESRTRRRLRQRHLPVGPDR